ncbi:hypothetical protein FQA39_LY07268 [Lamprigera yunnana]|nr:hypothetical protein FQA39_LY07268 [Lamprigera yunnana]
MSESLLSIRLVIDNKVVEVPYTNKTIAEEVCFLLCKQLTIGPVTRHLFALRITGKQKFIAAASTFNEKHSSYDFRIRFKVANLAKLKELDRSAYDYYFYQVRSDVLENKIPDLIYEKYKRELVGLGVTDMYRVMLEKDLPRESVESEYRKYIPKEVLKRHSIFIKKPIHDSLGKIKKSGHDAWYVKMEYLKQLEVMAPEYLAEEYKAITDVEGVTYTICVKVSPFHPTQPGIRICYESKRDHWDHVCTIEELCYISVRKDGTVEISRKNGIPFYLKFSTLPHMLSFVSLLDGYYRLTCKWIFNLCKDVPTPSLQKLYSMKCHGPVGGEFSYAKLEEKRCNRPGCFILRESESKHNIYYIDVCLKNSKKPKTFKLEKLATDEFIFNDDLRRYKNIQQLMAAYNDPKDYIYLQECLPPSEYDKSPLLLCQDNSIVGDSVTDSSALKDILSFTPLCINSKDLQVYKGLEYKGYQTKTESGVRCQPWATENPIHKVEQNFSDSAFPDFSKRLAKNFCRNPNKDLKGPWCYTMNYDLIYDTCGIPICSFTECRVTGPGIEYSGTHNYGASERKCLKWKKKRNKVKFKNSFIKIDKFNADRFPDKDFDDVKKYCRNPDGNIGGPWCFVENEETNDIEQEFCDVSDVYLCLEYKGYQTKTESGVRCQPWATENPIHKVEQNFSDSAFPDFSKRLAKNFCRNPNKDLKGPWCYTMNYDLIYDTCGIPICSFTECRVTGPGIEYSGTHNYGASERKCLKWKKKRNKVKFKNSFIKIDKFNADRFPDKDFDDVKKYCRNPDGNIGGPWCFVENEETNDIEQEFCDVPFCDIMDSLIFSKNYPKYSHYHSYNHSERNFTFGIKLWDSDSYNFANARLTLSLYALPLNQQQIHDSEVSIEISISSQNASLSAGYKGSLETEMWVGVLKSTEFTYFSIIWQSGYISLHKEGLVKPLFLNEFKVKKNLIGFLKEKFAFYSFQGTNILWTFPFTIADSCTVHTTTSLLYQHFFPLPESRVGLSLLFHIRTVHSASILLVTSPSVNFPRVELTLVGLDNLTRIIAVKYENGPNIVLKEIHLHNLLSYWKWNELSIGLFSDTLNLYWYKDFGSHLLIEVKHDIIRHMRWYSPSSYNSVALWTFNCKPPEFAKPHDLIPPDCVLNSQELNYKGRQSVTNRGLPCLPWASKKLIPEDIDSLLDYNETMEAQNFCRNPKNNFNGSFCYAIHEDQNSAIEKTYCDLKVCRSAECKMAGTGNDYVGKVNVTRSNRTCNYWVEAFTNNTYPEYNNDTLFPDISIEDAENFCRNPSRTIAGSWCFTTDILLHQDVCNIRDCEKLEECTVIVRGDKENRYIYILPQWKETGLHGGLIFSVKQWDPDLVEGILIEIKPLNESDTMTLIIGAEYNEKVLLYSGSDLIKHKTFPHLIPLGKWTSFWLQIRKGEILLGFEGVPNPFFEWKEVHESDVFEPVLLSYSSLYGHPIGISFKCDSCHLEITNTTESSKVMSVGLWSEEEHDVYKNLTLIIRGTGTTLVQLYTFPDSESYEIVLNSDRNKVVFFKNKTLIYDNSVIGVLFSEHWWTKFVISFSESNIEVSRNDSFLMKYTYKDLALIYWFSLTTKSGSVTWSANCNPPDIDGKPINGGWSHWLPWQCTVSCGGGEGFRTRTCSNPLPNVFGKLCEGPSISTGRCNEFECGDISPETIDQIRRNLQSQEFSLIVQLHESIVIENDHDLLDIISIQSPQSYYEWTLNGLPIAYNQQHLEFKNDNILIKNAKVTDAGVYVCVVYRINKVKMVLRVVSLAVTTEDDLITTRATLGVTLKSNSVVLGYIYSDLQQRWLLNDKAYIDYGITTLAAVSSEYIKSLNESHTGVWKCVVDQYDLHFRWITNIVKIKIISAPTIYSHLREDSVSAPLFSWIKTDEGQKKEGPEGITVVYRSMWCLTKGKKMEVAMKVLKHSYYEKYLKSFMELAGRWAFLQSASIVRLFGITLSSPVSMVLEHVHLGPLDSFLRNNKSILKTVDLIESASNLASALWHLQENFIVHGNIRCRKLLVSCHEENAFTVKLGDPGIFHTYASKEVHWIPVECYSNLEYAKHSTAADVWAFATTLWEIFMYGETIKNIDYMDAMRYLLQYYASGKRLPQPTECPNNIYQLMQECWDADPHCRKQPQALMRDINQILYQVYNSRRIHSYSKVSTKSNLESQLDSISVNSLFSTATESTVVGFSEELISVSDVGDHDCDLSNSSHDDPYNSKWNFNTQDVTSYEDDMSCDFSTILSNLNFSVATSATSLDSISSMQSIFELDANCNVILQGRIGQGFYGEVYKGTLEYLGDKDCEPRQVAVKKLKASAVSTGLQDFEREISIMKTLKHPNIVEILGVLQDPEVSLVMEFVTHGSLQSYLKIYRESLLTKQLLKYALDISKGMDYLGTKHIVHRDLAARNILVVDENHVKISDFGLAQVMEANEYYILKTNRELPIKWYAPESLRDGKFSVRSDVWSYGVTMCEMFAYGEEPNLAITLAGETVGQEQQILLNAIESGTRFPCPPMCPQSVYVRIIYPCWQANPHERSTFQQLQEEIVDLLSQH